MDNNGLRTAKEVYEITGLTRKDLFDYEDVVHASERSNWGYESYRNGKCVQYKGYKLYDESALEKFQLISIFKKINIPKAQIKKYLKDYENDINGIIDLQIDLLNKQKKEIEDAIQLAEDIRGFGVKSLLSEDFFLNIWDIENIQKYRHVIMNSPVLKWVASASYDMFELHLDKQLCFYQLINNVVGRKENPEEYIKIFISFIRDIYGFSGVLSITCVALIYNSDGSLFEMLNNEIVNNEEVMKALPYIKDYLIVFYKNALDLFARPFYRFCIRLGEDKEIENNDLLDFITQIKRYFGFKEQAEFDLLLAYISEAVQSQHPEVDLFIELLRQKFAETEELHE